MGQQYADYRDVPWYRRSGTVNIIVLAGFFAFPPLLWAACILCLTGEIYTHEPGEDGFLTKCPSSIKVVGVLVLMVQSVAIIYGVYSNW